MFEIELIGGKGNPEWIHPGCNDNIGKTFRLIVQIYRHLYSADKFVIIGINPLFFAGYH